MFSSVHRIFSLVFT
uniref:Uncharacterized protein n=1 Tax=Lepeophtheirus salmonis TaxID=72036 RepID=A0A0K2U2G6_LEPSM